MGSGHSIDSESNRVTSWQCGVRFATTPTNFLFTQLVGPIIAHRRSIKFRLCPLQQGTAKVRRAITTSDAAIRQRQPPDIGPTANTVILPPRTTGKLNADRQSLTGCARANDDSRPTGEIVRHCIAETGKVIVVKRPPVRQRGEGTDRGNEDIEAPHELEHGTAVSVPPYLQPLKARLRSKVADLHDSLHEGMQLGRFARLKDLRKAQTAIGRPQVESQFEGIDYGRRTRLFHTSGQFSERLARRARPSRRSRTRAT